MPSLPIKSNMTCDESEEAIQKDESTQQRQQFYTHLYQSHHHWLRSWLRFRVSDLDDADDLMQDTYTRLLRNDTRPPQEKARSFLIQIARGLVIDRHRRKQLEMAYYDTLSSMPEAEVPSEEDRALILEQLVRIDTALKTLPEKVRVTFLMSRFENLTYQEIAEQLSVSVASVRKYMLQALQACMEEQEANQLDEASS